MNTMTAKEVKKTIELVLSVDEHMPVGAGPR